ncbi:MBL fold metallo-hydrolase [Mucilaginibacter auburnensis]|uniref:Glyoxylase-like metal-dependent hydrolase (Beta-lactamase superfamily II) n=1 Tax=Mucilaginibacter auburnensis TaxID=1457233 RepID=A0A2H9VP20_9SPHI|nr:MBL fold metallo-hydrolase [Mucilaginibacter auburnensis]PJJ80076.1 glyoxylase-like metal-dependent hydrolase (beta-lactamase superfamily II) [Mucilaginibacter auburnensis]
MIIEQIYTGCLAQGAYYIQSGKEAAIIDPLREVAPYIDRAERGGATIKYVLETHFHADFVSGHIDLAQKTGANIVFGPLANPSFEAYQATDGEELKVGKVKIRVIHTPGHTMESTCFLLIDEAGKETALFSGDTLFIGDVGRPDLAQKAADMTMEQLAGTLFDSLRNKIMPLADDIIVYPAHGAGSACGKNMSKETTDTLGNQKKYNYALRANMTREEFITEVTRGLDAPPAYFPQNVRMNKEGYESIDSVISSGLTPLSPDAFEAAANELGALVLDTRNAQTFAAQFIPNSVNIGIDGSFAPWVGALIPDVAQPILLVTEAGREEEVVTRLARVGFDNTIGYLNGGMAAWIATGKETDQITSIDPVELAEIEKKSAELNILDVRKNPEYLSEHVVNAQLLPLDNINENITTLDRNKTYYVHCAGGYRSMIFTSMMRARGFDNLIDVKGGFAAIKASGLFTTTDYVCPSTLTD